MSESQHEDAEHEDGPGNVGADVPAPDAGGVDDDPELAAELGDDVSDASQDADTGDTDGTGDIDTDDADDVDDDADDADATDDAGAADGGERTGDGVMTRAASTSVDGDAADDDPHADESPAEMVRRLEHEGDVAADYLEELLDIADLDGDIDLDVENGRAMVSIVGDGLESLVGQGGAALDALQDLTRLAVLRATGERSRLMLDIAGTRARRRDVLRDVAADAVSRVRDEGAPVKLDPMTPFERKVVHDAIAEAGLRSESEGLAAARRVVVYPA